MPLPPPWPSAWATTMPTPLTPAPSNGPGSLTKIGSGRAAAHRHQYLHRPDDRQSRHAAVNGSLVSPVTVQSGGILSGTGHLGSVTVTPGGQLAPGSPLGAMHVSGSLNLESGAVMDYELDTPATSSEVLMPAGRLLLSGQQFSDFDFTWTANFGPGTYPLIAFGSTSGSLGANSAARSTAGVQPSPSPITISYSMSCPNPLPSPCSPLVPSA